METIQEKKPSLSHILDYSFYSETLLKEALTDPSTKTGSTKPFYQTKTNERLKFLGSSILNMVISEILFRKFPNDDEGLLSHKKRSMISEKIKVNVARRMNICQYLIVNPENGGACNDGTMRHGIEALIGAMYIDGGLEVARTFISNYWFDAILPSEVSKLHDFKTQLQFWAHKNKKPLPTYSIVERTGAGHNLTFTVLATIENFGSEFGIGKTKRIAEQNAAETFCSKIMTTSPN